MSLSSAIIYEEMCLDEKVRALLMISCVFTFYLFILYYYSFVVAIQNENLQNSVECFPFFLFII